MVINYSHQKGGTGKSTLAYHTAQAFKELGYKTTIYDLDTQDSCLGFNSLREHPKDNIINVEDEDTLIDIIKNTKDNEIDIIDSGGFDSGLTSIAIMGADINITPIADKVSEILAIANKYSVILERIEKSTNEKTKTHVLLNKIHIFASNFSHIEDIISSQERMETLQTIIRDRGIYDKALREGLTVHEATHLKGHEDAKKELNNLAKEILKKLKKDNK
ncbi:MAG: ParA family protein [Sulfurovum sp.]|nr:ParA family protein [Sulfurovum sp.]